MPRKLRKDRVFRHMARDTPDRKIFCVDRDEIIKNNEFLIWFTKSFSRWQRMMAIKHEDRELEFATFQEYDIDFMRYRFVMEARVGGRL